jgi:hypothetical protein
MSYKTGQLYLLLTGAPIAEGMVMSDSHVVN